MVLDRMRRSRELLFRKRACEVRHDAFTLALVANAIEYEAKIGALSQHEAELLPQIRLRILVDGHVLDAREADAARVETVADSFAREARPMLDAAKALLLDCRDDLAVA